jgi:hypothetical protein
VRFSPIGLRNASLEIPWEESLGLTSSGMDLTAISRVVRVKSSSSRSVVASSSYRPVRQIKEIYKQ